MSEKSDFESIPIGLELGTLEMTLDEDTVNNGMALVQWKARELVDRLGVAPPGITIGQHARIKWMKFPDMRAGIWAKSEHEFIKPMKIGSKISIRGKVVDKYVKRGRNYLVSEFETVDESGEVLMSSRETGVHVE
jgi:hypothetical protein